MNKLVIVLLFFVTGCASITGSKMQPVSVQTIQDNKEISGAGCTLTNDAGKWFVTSPGSVTIQKSTGDLAVDCKKGEAVGHETVVSKANGSVWGNIIAGGGIGYVVDRNTGAGFDYPTTISVAMRGVMDKLGEVVGLRQEQSPVNAKTATQTDNSEQQTTGSPSPKQMAVSSATLSTSDTSKNSSSNLPQKLRDLQALKNEGVITDEEFRQKKQQLLDKL